MIVTVVGSGTSQGVPVIACHCNVCKSNNKKDSRLRSSIHIQYNDKSIVVDTGPDFRQQMLENHIEYLDAVLFTHEHKDHVAGLDDVRPYNFKQKKPVDIYCSNRVFEALKREYIYIFDPKFKYPGIPQINQISIDKNSTIRIEQILQRSLSHDVAAVHTGTRTDVHHVISSTNRVFIVFHHHEGVTQITQPLEGGQQAVVIALMQADARFIEHVEHPGQTGADLRGQTNALRFAA